MIIASHTEIDKGMFDDIVQPHIQIERFKYTDSDIIFKEGVDYERYDKTASEITFDLDTLSDNLKYIYQDAYAKGLNDAINQMMHP